MQKPHWSAWWRRNDSCSGVRPASPASDSTVDDGEPSACTASRQQPRTATPSRSTVHAPQTPCSQPTCVPVRPSRWRRKSVSSRRGSTVSRTARPLTVSSIADHRARSIAPSRRACRSGTGGSRTRRASWTGDRRGVRRARPPRPPPRHPTEPTSSASTSGRRVGRSVTAPTPTRASTTTRLVATEHDGGHRLREVAGAERELLERARLPVRRERPDGLDDELARVRAS